jgi:hypothetical protein
MVTAQQTPGATAEFFPKGNHTEVALNGDPRQWQTHAALGLCGKPRAALDGLGQFDEPAARFYQAVCHWIDGDEDAACALLAQQHNAHASNLLALIRKPVIEVLAQLPWTRGGCSDLISGAQKDSKFRVRNISFHQNDLPNTPYADIHSYYDPAVPPDFYVCQMVEWHSIPPNIQQLPCPLLGQTADYDLHIQAVYPWLQLFDELLVTDPTEWRDVQRLVSVPVSTFAKSFGVPDNLPPLTGHFRNNDLYLSGTVLHPYHPDKASLLHQILRIEDARLKIINGFHGRTEYHKNLANAKVCVTYIRHSGALPTRGLEALALGCGLIVQKDNVLTLWLGETDGVLTYDLEKSNLDAAIKRILADWPEFQRRVERGSRVVREEFALSRVASQYLRYLTYLAARPRQRIPSYSTRALDQKRCVVQTGWLPCYDFDHSRILDQINNANQRHLLSRLNEAPDVRLVIDAIRESVLHHHHRAWNKHISVAEWLRSLRPLLRRGLEIAPRSIVLRFNFVRVLYHYGDDDDAREARILLEETIGQADEEWSLDVMDDVFPWDFFPSFFNYRTYFDRITQHLMESTDVEVELKRIIRASLCYYMGYFASREESDICRLEHFQRAATLDPAFPYYQFHYARALLERRRPKDEATARALLHQLVSHSSLFLESYELLELDHANQRRQGATVDALAPIYRRAREQITFLEGNPPPIDRTFRWRRRSSLQLPLVAAVVDRLVGQHGPMPGLAHLAMARDLDRMTQERVSVLAVDEAGVPRLSADSGDFFEPKLSVPCFRFLVVDPAGLTPRAAAEEYGDPTERIVVGEQEVWLYERVHGPRFNRFLGAQLATRLRAVRPFRGPASHLDLSQPRPNLTPVNTAGIVRLAVGDALDLYFDRPFRGGLIDCAAGWTDRAVLECSLDGRLVAVLRLPEVPWTGVCGEGGLQARLLSLPQAARNRPWNRMVVRPLGLGTIHLGHVLVFPDPPLGLTPSAVARSPRRFPAEFLPTQTEAKKTLVEDATAQQTRVRRCSPSFRGFLSFGPYLSLSPGRYRADFALRIDDLSSPGIVACLDVTADGGRQLNSRELAPSDFRLAGRYLVQGVTFSTQEELDAVEFRVFAAGTRAVSMDYIDLVVLPDGRRPVRLRR